MVKRSGTSDWISGTAGMDLQAGDTIKSGNNSKAEITFFDGSILELSADTLIVISELSVSGSGTTTIRLQQEIGNTFSRINKLTDSASSYEIETPAAVAAVRGSMMTVTVYDDGKTVVTNNEGDIRVTAQGVTVIIPEGSKSTIQPGLPPGTPEPADTPPTTTTTTTTPIPPGPVYTVTIDTGVQADVVEVHIGETITYTYHISNTGNIALQNIQVTDDITGEPAYQGGDTNNHGVLDPGETWLYTATHVANGDDPSPLVNTATFTATLGTAQLTAVDHAQVDILPPGVIVTITSPENEATVNNRTITITGTVSDTSITQATMTINDYSHTIGVTQGNFSNSENVNFGVNDITVSVSYGDGQTASDTITINVTTPSTGIRIELTWDSDNTDVDSHFIRPGGTIDVYDYNNADDCFWNNRYPDWGAQGDANNPSLDQDDMDGYGPENITLQDPFGTGIYQYKVFYWDDYGNGATTATVRIWIDGAQVFEASKQLLNHELWDCANIYWPQKNVIAISLNKRADVASAAPGNTIHYTYEVANNGNVPLDIIQVTDNLCDPVASLNVYYNVGDTNQNNTLDPGETWIYVASYIVNIEDPNPLVNFATARGMWMVIEHNFSDTDTVSIIVIRP